MHCWQQCTTSSAILYCSVSGLYSTLLRNVFHLTDVHYWNSIVVHGTRHIPEVFFVCIICSEPTTKIHQKSLTCVASHFLGRCLLHSQCWNWEPLCLLRNGEEKGSQELIWAPSAWRIFVLSLKMGAVLQVAGEWTRICLFLETGFRFLMHR